MLYPPMFWFWLLAIMMTMPACSTIEPQKVPVTEYRVIVRTPPDVLMKDCTVTPPPSAESYVNEPWHKKEKILTDFAAKQMFNLGDCNKDKAALRKWKEEQLENAEKLNKSIKE